MGLGELGCVLAHTHKEILYFFFCKRKKKVEGARARAHRATRKDGEGRKGGSKGGIYKGGNKKGQGSKLRRGAGSRGQQAGHKPAVAEALAQ